jgi:cytidylate kinase
MKKTLFAAVAAIMFAATGCGVVLLSGAEVANRVRLGMSVNEFKKLAGQHAELDAMSSLGSVYRIDKHNIGIPDYVVSVTLYHFDADGRLTEVETRDLAPPFYPTDRPLFEPLIP